MCLRLLDYKLKENKLVYSLVTIYGVGLVRSNYICSLLGLNKHVRLKYLNKYFNDILRYGVTRYMYILGKSLNIYFLKSLEFYVKYISYPGFRFLKGLSWHGQRTSSNSKSSKRFSIKYKSVVLRKNF